jgi:hypothetical protein
MANERSSGSGIARIVSAVVGVIAIVLIAHIVLVFADAHASGVVKDIASFASTLAWGFKSLFSFKSAKLTVFTDYGLAALAYLLIGGIVVRLFRHAE